MNWIAIIDELLKAGLTQSRIADHCGTTQSHISFLRTGERKRPSWELGNALLKLHAEHCAPAESTTE
jgi:transcriptional regulator with XRE-family HTH domain